MNWQRICAVLDVSITYDAMNDPDNAIQKYECALSLEEDFTTKVWLMNALSHLHMKVGGQSQLAVDYLKKSLQIQQDDANNESTDANLLFETMILYGHAMVAENSFSQAINWYESALRSNPDKRALHPSNSRAWCNKGAVLFINGDAVGAACAFGHIVDEVKKNPTTAPSETASVLTAIGSIFYANGDFANAIECFTECLSLKNGCLSPCQRAGTLCNIGSVHYRMHNYEESKKYFNEALMVAESVGGTSLDLRATIMCKLAYIHYRRRQYLRAHNLFSDAAS